MELADILDLKSSGSNTVRVQVPPPIPLKFEIKLYGRVSEWFKVLVLKISDGANHLVRGVESHPFRQ